MPRPSTPTSAATKHRAPPQRPSTTPPFHQTHRHEHVHAITELKAPATHVCLRCAAACPRQPLTLTACTTARAHTHTHMHAHAHTHTRTHTRAHRHTQTQTQTHTHTHTHTHSAARRPGVLHAAHLRLPSRRCLLPRRCDTQAVRRERSVTVARSSPRRPTRIVPPAWPCLDQTSPAAHLQVCLQGCLPPPRPRPPRPSAGPDGDGRLRRRATTTAAALGTHSSPTPRCHPTAPRLATAPARLASPCAKRPAVLLSA